RPPLIAGRATATRLALARGATRRAATGLVGEALLREELLLARREGEGAAAAAAGEDSVRVAHRGVPGGSERSDSAPGVTWRTPTWSIVQQANRPRGRAAVWQLAKGRWG